MSAKKKLAVVWKEKNSSQLLDSDAYSSLKSRAIRGMARKINRLETQLKARKR